MTLPKADWIFFFSPSGVALFAEKFDANPYKIGVIGLGTKLAVEKHGWTASFIPDSSSPEKGIGEFAKTLTANQVVIMACGDKSLKRMSGAIPQNQMIEWEFYENVPAQEIEKSNADYLIFTSPSNADAYLEMHAMNKMQTAVAIGKTTFAALEKRGVQNIVLSGHPSEEGIWNAVLKESETRRI